MRISYTPPEQEELRRELRTYFGKLMTPPERQEALSSTSGGEIGTGNVYRETVSQMGKDGWLTLNWPEEYGGQNRDPHGLADLHRRGRHRRRAGALPDDQQRRADDHGVRHR